MRRATVGMLLLLWTVGACGGQAATGAPATPGAAATAGSKATAPAVQTTAAPAVPTAAPASVDTGGSGTSVAHVVIAGGPQAGTYDGNGPKVDCNIGATGSGATYQDLVKADGMTGLTFISGEGGASPTKLYLQVIFGPVTGIQTGVEVITLDPATAKGSGKAQLEDRGSTIKWTFDAKTADGVAFTGSVECGPVDRR